MHQASTEVNMARKLFSYTRFSGDRQEFGESQRRQDEMIAAAARAEGVPVDTTTTLRDKGVSAFRGRNWHRGDLGKFLDLVDDGVIPKGSILCVERVNRMSRMPWMQQVELWREILSRGIVIRTCEPAARYTAANMNDLAIGCPVVIYMMLGNLESQQKSDWSNDAFAAMKRRSREEGAPHNLNIPPWIDRIAAPHPKDPERRVTTGFQLNEERAALLQWMHAQSQAGQGDILIAKDLIRRGVGPWGNRGKWTVISIANYLTTRTAVGEHQPTRLNADGVRVPDGPPIPGLYPTAVDEDCWRRTQAARTARRHKGGRRSVTASNLFTHLVKDAAAESSLRYVVREHGRLCYLTTEFEDWNIPYRQFELAALAAIEELTPADVDGRHVADALTVQVHSLQQQRCRLALDLDALDKQLRELPAERWPKRAVARMAELEDAITKADEELRAAKEQADTSTRTEALTDLQTCIRALGTLEKRIKAAAADKIEPLRSELAGLRNRIKGRIPFLVESVWVRMQIQNRARRYVHVRIYLHGGEERSLLIVIGQPTEDPLPLDGADFRGGDERGYVARAGGVGSVERKATVPAVAPGAK